jgi:hypothetical protein
MDLIIKNKCITAPIELILNTLKKQLHNGKLKDITSNIRDNISVTCPVHKDGYERNPSCNIYTSRDNDNVEYGRVHCFTCGFSASLPQFINACFDEKDITFGEEWLLEYFGDSSEDDVRYLPEIILPKHNKKKFIDESILRNYAYYHPYMWKRGLSKEVVDFFQIGFDEKSNMIVFPVWDEFGNLVMLTRRSVKDKRFYIDEDVDKPVYLLNTINKFNYKEVYVCESQINALTLWSWGYPAIALFGTGSQYQYDILNKCGIRHYILAFDGDEAGDKGAFRFKKNIRKDVFVSQKIIPNNKDVNDLSKEQFDSLPIIS